MGDASHRWLGALCYLPEKTVQIFMNNINPTPEKKVVFGFWSWTILIIVTLIFSGALINLSEKTFNLFAAVLFSQPIGNEAGLVIFSIFVIFLTNWPLSEMMKKFKKLKPRQSYKWLYTTIGLVIAIIIIPHYLSILLGLINLNSHERVLPPMSQKTIDRFETVRRSVQAQRNLENMY